MKIYCLQIKKEGKMYFYAYTAKSDRTTRRLKAMMNGEKWHEWTLNTRNKDPEGCLIHEDERISGTFAFYQDKNI